MDGPVDPFARPGGNLVMKRKGDDDGGGWGGDSWGRGGGGGGNVRGKGKKGSGASEAVRRGKALKVGSFGDVAGRTFGVLEVGCSHRRALGRQTAIFSTKMHLVLLVDSSTIALMS